MALHFYFSPGGPFAHRCLLTLAAKNLVYTAHPLDTSKQEHRTPEMLALNPRGALPLLQDGSTLVRESQAIMFYLDRAYPDPPLYGRTPVEAGRTMQEICEQAAYLDAHLRAILGPVLFGQSIDNFEDAVTTAAKALQAEFAKLDERLQREAWLAGDALSAADINIYPFFAALVRAMQQPQVAVLDLGPPIAERYSSIGRWMKDMGSLQIGGH